MRCLAALLVERLPAWLVTVMTFSSVFVSLLVSLGRRILVLLLLFPPVRAAPAPALGFCGVGGISDTNPSSLARKGSAWE